MTTIRKFAFAALLAATTLTLAPSPASAQESARGHFTLTHDVRWGSAKIPAGDYDFAFDPQTTAPILMLSKLNGVRMGFMVLVPNTEDAKATGVSRLVLASSAEGSYVTAMELPEFGMILHFTTPAHVEEKQIAKASTAPSSGQ